MSCVQFIHAPVLLQGSWVGPKGSQTYPCARCPPAISLLTLFGKSTDSEEYPKNASSGFLLVRSRSKLCEIALRYDRAVEIGEEKRMTKSATFALLLGFTSGCFNSVMDSSSGQDSDFAIDSSTSSDLARMVDTSVFDDVSGDVGATPDAGRLDTTPDIATHDGGATHDGATHDSGAIHDIGGAAYDIGGDDSSQDGANHDSGIADAGRRIIFYWGNGGLDPARAQDSGVGGFSRRSEQLENAGYDVELTDSFPSDLESAVLLVLIRPGKNWGQPFGEPFSMQEIAQMEGMLRSGGVVVMGGDAVRSNIWLPDEANRLGAEFGSEVRFLEGHSSEGPLLISPEPHALTAGVSSLLTLAVGLISLGDRATCLAFIAANCVLSVEQLSGGSYVALADLNMIDDYSTAVDGVDNLQLLINLAGR